MTDDDWREIPLDPETQALRNLAPSAVGILQDPSSPLEWPRWVEDFLQSPHRLELSGREGSETLDSWRAQTGEKLAALLESRPWGLLHMLGLLRRLPTDRCFLGEKEAKGSLRRFDRYQATVTECLVLKYARWDASGVELEAWQPAPAGLDLCGIPNVDFGEQPFWAV